MNEYCDEIKTVDKLKVFINRADSVSAVMLQNIVFFSEIYAIEHVGKRVTDVCFKSMKYGPYSYDIRELLDNLIEENPRTIISGCKLEMNTSQPTFHYAGLPNQIGINYVEYVDNIVEVIGDWGMKELLEFNKLSTLYKMNTSGDGWGKQILFDNYRSRLESGLEPDIGIY
jgi:hypothetical protein